MLTAGGIDLTVSFLSPVEVKSSAKICESCSVLTILDRQPTDLLNQSIPFSYLAVSAKSNDGSSHTVSVYSDISAEWVTGNNDLTANWSTTTGDLIFHQVQLEEQTEFGEISDHIQRKRGLSLTTQR